MIIATSTPRRWKIGAALIKWYQGGTEYSHVLMIKDDLVYQASHGSVNCQHIEVFLIENQLIHAYDIGDELVDFEFVKRQLGKGYGFFQLIKIALKFILGIKLKDNGNKRFICSEFVGKALRLNWVSDYTDPKQVDQYLKEAIGGGYVV